MTEPIIRPIEKKDNPKIAAAIREVLVEHGVPKVGTTYEDVALDCMFETYGDSKAIYFVVSLGDVVLGGAGIAPLANYDGNICELQKMYFTAALRGKGIGQQMMQKCLTAAAAFGFEKCYIETMPYMEAAQKLYVKNGFKYIDGPMGDTGHYSCPVYMLKEL